MNRKINTRTFDSKYNEIISINNENCYLVNNMFTKLPSSITLDMKDSLVFDKEKTFRKSIDQSTGRIIYDNTSKNYV